MAPADTLSPPGSSSYSSNTMDVGDGTWDFSKNTFLLPNLVGLNFATMQYNGMGNRFSTVVQYHNLVTGHAVMAALTFLLLVPIAVMTARFHTRRPGFAIRYHTYLQILAVFFSTVVLILGWFAVGPERSLTNPHHGIGVAIYTMILVQAIGGRLIRHIGRPSIKVALHKWIGRTVALLGIVQIPLGMTLYGCAKYLFILYSLWMALLLLVYFILSHRREKEIDGLIRRGGGYLDDGRSRYTERKSGGGMMGWLAPLLAGAGAFALLSNQKRGREQSRSRSRSRSRVPSRSRSRRGPPEVIPSRRGSGSYIEEKYSDRGKKGEGMMDKVLGVGAALGAGALIKSYMDRRDKRRRDEEYSGYSEVATDTPSRRRGPPPRRNDAIVTEVSDETESVRSNHRRPPPILPGPGHPAMTTETMSATESRVGPPRPITPVTPRPSRAHGHSRVDSYDESDYSSYVSPSKRQDEGAGGSGGAAKGLLAGLGLGWFAKKMNDRREKKQEERYRDEEDRRAGYQASHFTGDGYPSPTRRESRRARAQPAPTATEMTESSIEQRPQESAYSGPPMPPLLAGSRPPPMTPVGRSTSRSRSTRDIEPVDMPAIPPDPQGLLHDSGSGSLSPDGRGQRQDSSQRRRDGEAAAAEAVASASRLADAEDRRRGEHTPVSVALRVHDDKDRKITLRRLRDDEAEVRRQQRRQRSGSVSSLSGTDTGSGRRYRREDSDRRRAEQSAERRVEPHEGEDLLAPLSPPNPAYAQGRRPKDSAYYSGGPAATPPGQAGPSGSNPAAAATVSTLGSPNSHGTWSGVSPSPSGPLGGTTASAADRRRRRRLERRDQRPAGTVEFE